MRTLIALGLLLCGCYLDHGPREGGDVRTTVVKPLGVITQPNKYGSYPDGALSQGKNVHLRKPGVLSSVPLPEVYKSDALASSQIARRMWAGASKLLVASDDGSVTYGLRWVDSSSATALSGTSGLSYAHGVGKVQAFQHLGRWYVTGRDGVFAIASEGASSFALAGFAPPRAIVIQSGTATDATAIEANKTASWKALFVRKSATGEIIKIGPPSTALQVDNNLGATLNLTFRVKWTTSISANLLAGDYLELYRTATQDTGTDPGESYFLAATVALTSTDLTNKYADIQDSSSDAALGSALYTNDEEGGETAVKYPPGYAVDATMFKGSAFYVAQKVAGFLTVRVPSAWGILSTDAERTHGIGKRAFTATATSGSAVLTAVSNLKGLAAGQVLDDSAAGVYITPGTTIVSINTGASTVTMSANAVGSSGGVAVTATDVIELDGVQNLAVHPYSFTRDLGVGVDTLPVFDQAIHIEASGSAQVTMYGVTMTAQSPWYRYGPPTLRATNGANYSPPLPLLTETVATGSTDTRLNRLQISEPDQPEAVAVGAGNELLIGSGEIYRVLATTDALWVFASDGVHRVSGEYPDWRVDPYDPDLTIASRSSVGILKGAVWSYGPRGLVAFTDGAAPEEVSNGVVGDQIPGAVFSDTWNTALVTDDANDEVHVVTINGSTASIGWTFNTLNKAFTSTTYERTGDTYSTAHAYAPYLRALVWGAVQASAGDIIRAGSDPLKAMSGAAVDYQPVTGDGDPFTLKNWIECNYAFVPNADGFTILPRFDGTDFDASITLAIPYAAGPKEGRGVAGMPEGSALSTQIAPGFTIATAGTNSAWDFRGLSLRWVPAAEESM